ncbi:hypothetical protein BpHYR1_019394 [Brachionus plicatilis]|uniref:Uncharacterized protein n=1 Tax=Brachionus plicatilis TaxID=10195 RepID=A0A3M7QP14_BRAPC|nr:hypothetical protein BpHYR1_019394 [Brachionus plicatilis]
MLAFDYVVASKFLAVNLDLCGLLIFFPNDKFNGKFGIQYYLKIHRKIKFYDLSHFVFKRTWQNILNKI